MWVEGDEVDKETAFVGKGRTWENDDGLRA
jgi:hypothetical protein